MSETKKVKQVLNEHKQELRKKFKVKNLGIFGSYARGKQKNNSDIDILVEFYEPLGLEFFTLENYLSEILKIKVDLVTRKAIKQVVKKSILKEVSMI